MELKQLAMQLACEYHKGQFRWDGITPYIIHPIGVAKNFTDEKYIATSLLHDVIEDCNVSADDLHAAGIPEDVVEAVVLLTHHKGEDYLNYILALRHNKMAREVKIADIEYNMAGVGAGQRREKYRMALHILKNYKE